MSSKLHARSKISTDKREREALLSSPPEKAGTFWTLMQIKVKTISRRAAGYFKLAVVPIIRLSALLGKMLSLEPKGIEQGKYNFKQQSWQSLVLRASPFSVFHTGQLFGLSLSPNMNSDCFTSEERTTHLTMIKQLGPEWKIPSRWSLNPRVCSRPLLLKL